MRAKLIEAGDGEQIVVFPPRFELPWYEVVLSKEGDTVLIRPADPDTSGTPVIEHV